jgi:hypothetical protein
MHRHLFPACDNDGEIIEQLKNDVLFDRSFIYDRHLFSLNLEDNLKVTSAINIIQLPLMFILAFLRGDKVISGYFNIYQSNTIYQEIFVSSYSIIIIFLIISLIHLTKPHLDFKLLQMQGDQ